MHAENQLSAVSIAAFMQLLTLIYYRRAGENQGALGKNQASGHLGSFATPEFMSFIHCMSLVGSVGYVVYARRTPS